MSAVEVVDSYLGALPGGCRRLAHGEWGITVVAETLEQPVDLGISIADELVRVKAPALARAEAIDPWMLLWWNRQTRLVRFGCTRSRDIWVHADVPAVGLDARGVDRLLGLLVEAAVTVRGLRQPAAGG